MYTYDKTYEMLETEASFFLASALVGIVFACSFLSLFCDIYKITDGFLYLLSAPIFEKILVEISVLAWIEMPLVLLIISMKCFDISCDLKSIIPKSEDWVKNEENVNNYT